MGVKDLSLVTQEPLELKFSDDITFTIPVDPTLEFTYKLMDFEAKAQKTNSNKEQMDFLIDMVITILKQDTSQKIDRTFVKSNLSMSQIKAVVQIYQQQVMENNSNPN